jgi:hypothetical protein
MAPPTIFWKARLAPRWPIIEVRNTRADVGSCFASASSINWHRNVSSGSRPGIAQETQCGAELSTQNQTVRQSDSRRPPPRMSGDDQNLPLLKISQSVQNDVANSKIFGWQNGSKTGFETLYLN